MTEEHGQTRSRVEHSVVETDYDSEGRALVTRRNMIIHDFGDTCKVCDKMAFLKLAAR